MTLNELLYVCKETRWKVDCYGMIRTDDKDGMCPLCYAMFKKEGRIFDNHQAWLASRVLWMEGDLVDDVQKAADVEDIQEGSNLYEIRQELLKLVEGTA